MRISDWSSDVCSSDLSLPTEPTMLTLPMDWPRPPIESRYIGQKDRKAILAKGACAYCGSASGPFHIDHVKPFSRGGSNHRSNLKLACRDCNLSRSEEHTSEIQSLMRISYAVFCLQKKN